MEVAIETVEEPSHTGHIRDGDRGITEGLRGADGVVELGLCDWGSSEEPVEQVIELKVVYLIEVIQGIHGIQALGWRRGMRERGDEDAAMFAALTGKQHQPARSSPRQHQHVIWQVIGAAGLADDLRESLA